jgi:hypothetical protein
MPKGKGERRRWRSQNEEKIKGREHDKNEEIIRFKKNDVKMKEITIYSKDKDTS